ncbi:MAG: hypothetical protein ABIN79_07515 [Marmoricola sp.]
MSPSPLEPSGRDPGQHDPPQSRSPYSRHGAPPPLVAAAGLGFIQGVLTLGFGVTEALDIDLQRLTMGLTTAAFFIAYGATLIACAWGLNAVRPWARGPILLAQLIWLGLAWNFRHGDTLPIAIALAVSAFLVLAGLLHPRAMDALERAAGHR